MWSYLSGDVTTGQVDRVTGEMYVSLVSKRRWGALFLFLVVVSQHATYLGWIKDPLEIRIVCKCLLNHFNSTGDICLSKRYDLNSHNKSLRSLCRGKSSGTRIRYRNNNKPPYAPLCRRLGECSCWGWIKAAFCSLKVVRIVLCLALVRL